MHKYLKAGYRKILLILFRKCAYSASQMEIVRVLNIGYV